MRIKIIDYLDKDLINLNLKSKTKNEVIKELMKTKYPLKYLILMKNGMV